MARMRPSSGTRHHELWRLREEVVWRFRTRPSRRKGGSAVPLLVLLFMGNQLTHFGDGNGRKHAHEQVNQSGEESEGADKSGPIPKGRRVAAPRGRHEIARKTDT